jgi:L-lactate dehydrogenase complex protein LldG
MAERLLVNCLGIISRVRQVAEGVPSHLPTNSKKGTIFPRPASDPYSTVQMPWDGQRIHSHLAQEDVNPMETQEVIIQTMKEKAQAVQTKISEAGSLHEAFRYAIEITKEQGGSTIAAPGLDDTSRSVLKELCRENNLTLLVENLRDHLSGIHTGFAVADWGIAETATLVQDSSSEDVRIATMLSETHVAVLPRSRIKPDTMALEGELNDLVKSPSCYLAFISGASRTADIERVLTIGVHGPQELHILIVEDAQL